ncbi:MAG TPA: type II secretion system protein GspM [Verrucomicrobiae bacterium]|nr:type II secretion system protein GspM [Verrucomicrobiae bacterium]
MKITNRERSLLVITIAAILLGLNYLLLFPLVHHWTETGNKLIRERREIAGMKSVIAQKKQWQQEYDELKRSLGQRSERFEHVSDVMSKINQVAGNSGVIISVRRPLPEEDKGLYRVLPVQCTIEANTESLVRFLFALQTGAGFVSVEQLRVSPRPENPTILRCDVQVRALSGKMEGSRS